MSLQLFFSSEAKELRKYILSNEVLVYSREREKNPGIRDIT